MTKLASFDPRFGFYGSKSSPGTPPHVWKPTKSSDTDEKTTSGPDYCKNKRNHKNNEKTKENRVLTDRVLANTDPQRKTRKNQ